MTISGVFFSCSYCIGMNLEQIVRGSSSRLRSNIGNFPVKHDAPEFNLPTFRHEYHKRFAYEKAGLFRRLAFRSTHFRGNYFKVYDNRCKLGQTLGVRHIFIAPLRSWCNLGAVRKQLPWLLVHQMIHALSGLFLLVEYQMFSRHQLLCLVLRYMNG